MSVVIVFYIMCPGLLFYSFLIAEVTTGPVEKSFSFDNVICFSDPPIGCFSNQYPYNNTDKLPYSPDTIDVHINHSIGQQFRYFPVSRSKSVMKQHFRVDLKTVIVYPGYNELSTKYWVVNLVHELAKLPQPVNVVVIDWERGDMVSYSQAVANGRVATAMAAMFLQDIISLGVDPASIHIIGNSLGAHLAGDLASRFPGIGRVTGLDPSGSAMENFPPEVRLDPTDATVVDVYHTDCSNIFGIGTLQPMGTIDFYVNGALEQPGCNESFLRILKDWRSHNGWEKCSHQRAVNMFIDTINKCIGFAGNCSSIDDMTSHRCKGCNGNNSCIVYGYHLSSVRQNFRFYAFTTHKESPYC